MTTITRTKWTAHERHTLEQDTALGVERAVTAAKLKRSEQSVRKFAKRHGIGYQTQAKPMEASALHERWVRKLPQLIAALRSDIERLPP